MAKQIGIVKYKGTIGDIRHFKIKGLTGNFAGLNGGASAEQIKSDPAFVRTRENMNEFGGCAAVGKSVRVGLAQLMKQMSDPQLTGRLTAIMKKINLEDQSEARGYRAILVSTQSKYLVGLNFNRNSCFEGMFTAPVEVVASANRNAVTMSVEAFNTQSQVKVPAGATHFRLVNAISVISDFAFNSSTKIYEPIDSALNELSNVTYSDYIEVGATVSDPISIISTLPDSPTLTTDDSLLSCIGIEFYQKVGANYYLFNTGNALKIQTVF